MQIQHHCQTIAGMYYDTSKAELIGWVYDNSPIDSDYEGIKRHLMRHQDGHYFLFSLFGTMTSRPFGQVVPLSELDARQWSAKNGIDFSNGGSAPMGERRTSAAACGRVECAIVGSGA